MELEEHPMLVVEHHMLVVAHMAEQVVGSTVAQQQVVGSTVVAEPVPVLLLQVHRRQSRT
jgi:hypothetical protein